MESSIQFMIIIVPTKAGICTLKINKMGCRNYRSNAAESSRRNDRKQEITLQFQSVRKIKIKDANTFAFHGNNNKPK